MTKIQFKHKGLTENKEKYLEAITYWSEHVTNLLDNPDKYEKWLDDTGPNGEFLLSGNPIYSIIRKDKTKALRIMELEPKSQLPYMAAWVESFDMGTEKEIPVLAIGIVLSNLTEVKCLNLIEMWFKDIVKVKIDKAIQEINNLFEKNYEKSELEKKIELYYEIKELEPIKKAKFSTASQWGNTEIGYLKRLNAIRNHFQYEIISDDSIRNDNYVLQVYATVTALVDFINLNYKFSRTVYTIQDRNKIKKQFLHKHKDINASYILYDKLTKTMLEKSEDLRKELNIEGEVFI